MQPFRLDPDGVPVFTSCQIDDYGFPEHWGYDLYRIIENRDTTTFVTDYKMEQAYYKRPIHRYCRKKRFMTTLHQLLGDKGKVPEHVLVIILTYAKPGNVWNQIRRMLKHFKWSIYYNRIPYIIQQVYKQPTTKVSADQYRDISKSFDLFCHWFEEHKFMFERTYFPNMRFIALKLIEMHGITLHYDIPFARTQRKLKQLEFIWSSFNKN